jgi:hypothetical protein
MILNWLRKRKERKEEEEYQRHYEQGWSFAMYAYFVKHETVEDIFSYVECSNHFNDYDSFDSGIEDALKLIGKLEAKEGASL